MQTTTRDTLFGALLAAPIVAFPFARSYLLFYVTIILTALIARRTMPAIRTERDLTLGVLLLAGPVLITGQTSKDGEQPGAFKYLLQPNLLLR